MAKTDTEFWAQDSAKWAQLEREAAAMVEEGAPGDSFQERYWKGPLISGGTLWMGYPAIKSPFDLWTYSEIVHETQPTLIVETGTLAGASALYLAHTLDAVAEQGGPQDSELITIDIAPYPGLPEHPRITYFNGDSVGEKMLERVGRRAEGKRTMVILDSDHSYEHVIKELRAYNVHVSPGCYLIVEDTWGKLGYGAAKAVKEFLSRPTPFTVDRSRERHLMTFHPGGFLKRAE